MVFTDDLRKECCIFTENVFRMVMVNYGELTYIRHQVPAVLAEKNCVLPQTLAHGKEIPCVLRLSLFLFAFLTFSSPLRIMYNLL